MTSAYDPLAWGNLFVAEVGASAALVGLLFVAVSINLAKIIALPGLPGRALEALAVLVMVLFISTLALVPGQTAPLLGAEVVVVGTLGWVSTLLIQHKAPKHPSAPRGRLMLRVVMSRAATLPMIVGGVSVAVQRGGGLFWVVLGVLASFLAALINAWVLLIEILR